MTDIAPLIKRSLVDQALEQLRLRIARGAWAVGERLPTEPELCAELGISRNTVREAMRVLAFSGLIEIRQGDGSYLRSMTDPLGTMHVRCLIAPWGRRRGRSRFWKWKPSALLRNAVLQVTCEHCAQRWMPAPRCIRATSRPISAPTWRFTNVWWTPHTTGLERAVSVFLRYRRRAVAPDPEPFTASPGRVRLARCCLTPWNSKTPNVPNPSAGS